MFSSEYAHEISMFLGSFQLSYTALQLVKYQSGLVSVALMVFTCMQVSMLIIQANIILFCSEVIFMWLQLLL